MDIPYQELCKQELIQQTYAGNELQTSTTEAGSACVVVTQPPSVVQSRSQIPVKPPHIALGPKSSIIQCPHCTAFVKTMIKHTVTSHTHIAAALSCCCRCLPFCMDSTRNANHYCPNCQKYICTYKK